MRTQGECARRDCGCGLIVGLLANSRLLGAAATRTTGLVHVALALVARAGGGLVAIATALITQENHPPSWVFRGTSIDKDIIIPIKSYNKNSLMLRLCQQGVKICQREIEMFYLDIPIQNLYNISIPLTQHIWRQRR